MLGEYPGYVCYDAGRPKDLPFDQDTLAESMCKLQQAPGNILSCLNPFGTSCAPDSWLNLNIQHGKPNLDPTVSGGGITGAYSINNPGPVGDNTPTTTPMQDYTNLALIAVAGLALLAYMRH